MDINDFANVRESDFRLQRCASFNLKLPLMDV